MSDEGECRGVNYDSMRGVECVVEGVQGSGVGWWWRGVKGRPYRGLRQGAGVRIDPSRTDQK